MPGVYEQFSMDPQVEKDGIYYELGENSKGEPIRIRIARAGGSNVNYQRLLEKRTKPYRRQIMTDTMDRDLQDKIMREVYADTVILGWEGVEDRSKNPIQFTRENCVKLLTELPELFRELQIAANNIALYRADIREEEAKNSPPSSSTP